MKLHMHIKRERQSLRACVVSYARECVQYHYMRACEFVFVKSYTCAPACARDGTCLRARIPK